MSFISLCLFEWVLGLYHKTIINLVQLSRYNPEPLPIDHVSMVLFIEVEPTNIAESS